jgi:hypothetical protein
MSMYLRGFLLAPKATEGDVDNFCIRLEPIVKRCGLRCSIRREKFAYGDSKFLETLQAAVTLLRVSYTQERVKCSSPLKVNALHAMAYLLEHLLTSEPSSEYDLLPCTDISVNVKCSGAYHRITLTRNNKLILHNHLDKQELEADRVMEAMTDKACRCLAIGRAWKAGWYFLHHSSSIPGVASEIANLLASDSNLVLRNSTASGSHDIPSAFRARMYRNGWIRQIRYLRKQTKNPDVFSMSREQRNAIQRANKNLAKIVRWVNETVKTFENTSNEQGSTESRSSGGSYACIEY